MDFLLKLRLNIFYNVCRTLGIKTKRNYTCCPSCGHAELQEETDGDYVFYHNQEHQSLMEGQMLVHLQHKIRDNSLLLQTLLLLNMMKEQGGYVEMTTPDTAIIIHGTNL